MTVSFVLQLILLGIGSGRDASAWMPPTNEEATRRILPTKKRSPAACQSLNVEDNDAKEGSDSEVSVQTSTVEWGVSYIGGDPCGSKYNSDPFDKKPSDKPGMPDDMKARIAALAQKKLREESESSGSN
mmetsp:Transcript_8307/g.20527  ORF Transcript_8307/g.20527 Transcript_8307/m.20527 type:complete len:129 (-) Transcript_8307:143-529(-)